MNKLIVITTPSFFPDEASLIKLLFAEGMSRLHLRKPGCGRDELEVLLDKIPTVYYERIVLHDWFALAEERNLGGIHLNRRNPEVPPLYKGSISRSCHSLEEIIEYKPVCDYVFLSPVFQSISKEGYGSGFSLDELRNAKGIIDDKVIALGGISPQTITKLKDIPFGGAAVLGALWGNDPSLLVADQLIKQFKRLQVWP
ncbi:thiamine phosphate synthase [uncultured Parabacteroides sp.]|uniref:thiamine phosphate synthase n=1 Tax=uncultured Parabacteroides sp. TaxID=512312 RepID=UPI002613A556|nr:thiamine phosphate synthase [uncultured Parabacteroides sp.]